MMETMQVFKTDEKNQRVRTNENNSYLSQKNSHNFEISFQDSK